MLGSPFLTYSHLSSPHQVRIRKAAMLMVNCFMKDGTNRVQDEFKIMKVWPKLQTPKIP